MRPGHIKSVQVLGGGWGASTAATVNRTSLQPVNTERVYAERDMTRAAKTNWTTRR